MSAHLHPLPTLVWQKPRAERLAQALRLAWRVVRTRQDLAELDARMLRDIGLTPGDAQREIARAPWDYD